MLLKIIQSIGIFIPLAGVVALLRRGQFGKSSVRLLLASLGCLIMNCGCLLFVTSGNASAAMTALKVEYLGSKRCYKDAFTFDEAFRIVEEGLGTQFDPTLGRIFLTCRPELEALYSR